MKEIIQYFLKQFGYRISKISTSKTNILIHDSYRKEDLLKNFFGILRKIDFKVNHVIDVGAHRGTWTKEVLRYFPDSYFTLLEPQYWMKDSIADLLDNNPKIIFLPIGAGKEEGIFKFTLVGRDDSCTFRYSEQEAKEAGLEQIETEVITLNNLIKTSNLPFPEIVKIDAEGLDLNVLEGATELLGKVEVFMVEAGIVNKIFNNSLLKLINFMDYSGYNLFEITDLNRPFKDKVLWLVEVVFVKKNGLIDSITWQ